MGTWWCRERKDGGYGFGYGDGNGVWKSGEMKWVSWILEDESMHEW